MLLKDLNYLEAATRSAVSLFGLEQRTLAERRQDRREDKSAHAAQVDLNQKFAD